MIRDSNKGRELYQAVRCEQEGIGEDLTEELTCESALRNVGVNEALIAKKLKALLEAKQRRWNPKKKSWEEFDDYDIQLAAAKEIVKIFGGYPSESEGGGGTVVVDLGRLTPKEFRDDGRERSER